MMDGLHFCEHPETYCRLFTYANCDLFILFIWPVMGHICYVLVSHTTTYLVLPFHMLLSIILVIYVLNEVMIKSNVD